MKTIRFVLLLSCVLASVALLGDSASAQAPKAKARMLFLTQSKGFKHGSVNRPADKLAPAEIAMIQLGQQTGLFDCDCTQDAAADFTKENLAKYDLVAFYTTGELPISDAARDYFVKEWLTKKGHGFLGFHSATDTYRTEKPEHQWYWDIAGGSFKSHPWGSGTTVTLAVHDTAHPAMKPFGKEFQFKDEIYEYVHWVPENVHVLMSLDMEKCNPKRPYHVPVAWCRTWGDGKIFMNNLGHNNQTWTDQKFLDSTAAAVRWTLGLEAGDATPNPEVSKAWHEKSKKDAEAAK